MTTPHAILLIPANGDPHNLLQEGPCGARPPVMWYAKCVRRLVSVPHSAARRCGYCDTVLHECQRPGLALAWDGDEVWQGSATLTRHDLDRDIVHHLLRGETWARAQIERQNLGPLILLDKDDKEMT